MKPPRSQDPAQWLEDFRVNGDCATQQMVWCGSLGDTFDLPILSTQPCLQALPPSLALPGVVDRTREQVFPGQQACGRFGYMCPCSLCPGRTSGKAVTCEALFSIWTEVSFLLCFCPLLFLPGAAP